MQSDQESLTSGDLNLFIEYWRDNNLLLSKMVSSRSSQPMKKTHTKRKDLTIFRLYLPGNKDEKASIRKYSIFEKSRLDLRILYYIIFYNFLYKISITKAVKNIKIFFKTQLLPWRLTITLFYLSIADYIKTPIQSLWNSYPCDWDFNENVDLIITIDECVIHDSNNNEYYFIGIHDSMTQEVKIINIPNFDSAVDNTEIIIQTVLCNINPSFIDCDYPRNELTFNSYCHSILNESEMINKGNEYVKYTKCGWNNSEFSFDPIKNKMNTFTFTMISLFEMPVLNIISYSYKNRIKYNKTRCYNISIEKDIKCKCLQSWICLAWLFEKYGLWTEREQKDHFMAILYPRVEYEL